MSTGGESYRRRLVTRLGILQGYDNIYRIYFPSFAGSILSTLPTIKPVEPASVLGADTRSVNCFGMEAFPPASGSCGPSMPCSFSSSHPFSPPGCFFYCHTYSHVIRYHAMRGPVNVLKAEVAKMERERMTLAMQDRPLRSELESLNELHEGRLKAMEVELRRHTMEVSTRLQVWGCNVGVVIHSFQGQSVDSFGDRRKTEGVAMTVRNNIELRRYHVIMHVSQAYARAAHSGGRELSVQMLRPSFCRRDSGTFRGHH